MRVKNFSEFSMNEKRFNSYSKPLYTKYGKVVLKYFHDIIGRSDSEPSNIAVYIDDKYVGNFESYINIHAVSQNSIEEILVHYGIVQAETVTDLYKYLNFKEELLLENVLNESILYLSSRVKNILNSLSDNKIAKRILDSEKVDIKPDMTFIDLGKEGSFSFMTMRNAKNFLDNAYSKEIYNNHFSEMDKSPVDIERLLGDNDDIFKSRSRNEVSMGRFINRAFKGEFKDKEIEDFVNNFKALSTSLGEQFKLVDGEDIAYWYNYENYREVKGTLGNSCMARKGNLFHLYIENPEVCRMLVLLEDGKLIGRALVWKVEKINEVYKRDPRVFEPLKDSDALYYMDRQYTINDHDRTKFQNYAIEQGWYFREANNHYSSKNLSDGMETYNVDMVVKVKSKDYDKYPYMDTFKKFDKNSGTLYNNDDRENSDEMYILDDTGGGYTEVDQGVWSDWYGEHIPEEDSVYSEYMEDHIYSDDAGLIVRGRYSDTYIHYDHSSFIRSDWLDGYLHEDDVYYSNILDDYVYKDESSFMVTYVSDEGYVEDPTSNEDDCVVPEDYHNMFSMDEVKDLIWYKILSSLDSDWTKYDSISSDITSEDSDGNIILYDFRNELLKVKPNKYNLNYVKKIDAYILGLELEHKGKIKMKDVRISDNITYEYYVLKNHLDEMIKLAEEKREKNLSILRGDQKILQFDDHREYMNGLGDITSELYQRINRLKYIKIDLNNVREIKKGL